MDTPLLHALPEAARRALAENIPFPRRLGGPAEFAGLAQHVIENDCRNNESIRARSAALRRAPK